MLQLNIATTLNVMTTCEQWFPNFFQHIFSCVTVVSLKFMRFTLITVKAPSLLTCFSKLKIKLKSGGVYENIHKKISWFFFTVS